MSFDRRTFLAAGAATVAASAARAFEPAQRLPDPAVEVLDPSFAKYRIGLAAVERLATGFRWAEGPVWFGDMRMLLVSDVSNDRILKWDEETGELTTFRKPSNYANGNARDRQGRLLTCEHRTRRVTRTEHDGRITVLADRFEGKPLNSPNDVVCRSDGAVWFTDPAFGPNPLEAMASPELPGTIYRVDPATGAVQAVARGLKGPNGLCFSPDERILYVIEARAEPNRLIRAYDVSPDGTGLSSEGRVFFDCGKGTADGFRADRDGNLWCGWGMGEAEDGVVVLSPAGQMIGRIRLPERCANLCFGGRDRNRLLMASTRSLYALYVNTQGADLG
ncbi:SMP-30/gluconolactonase/LRE family protein [Methylobacterium sp. 17Sr1-1]|uniref:SMP-30/gluconolactonase/LRE family protein n=1 Tax=Methylobacterium sp. 17Sr1-1 TaxID=2202826 RepID=UPI000D6F90AB|nr:SMP-30/gluconolactonase/LRE family protein [Methylobacterium sp. 17Sr1-1]AWN52249.1 gluconolactonase [Methylobacterium sp. 17Sr1-1]